MGSTHRRSIRLIQAALAAVIGVAVPVIALTTDTRATTPAPVPVHIWPHFLRATKAAYDSKDLTPRQRSVIDNIVLTVSPSDRPYVRWEIWYGDVIVFVVKPSQLRSDGRSYVPSQVINDPNFFVDPADGSVFAWPPDSSPRVYASRWDPTCRGPVIVVSSPPGMSGVHISKIEPRIWPGFFKPAIVDYDRTQLDQTSRDLIDHIVGSLPTAERPNVRWLRDADSVAVFEVTLAQFCPGAQGYDASPVINEERRYVNPTDGELITAPPD